MIPESVRTLCLISIVLGVLPAIVHRIMVAFSTMPGWQQERRYRDPHPWRAVLLLPHTTWWARPAIWLLYLLAIVMLVVAVFNLPLGGGQ